MDELIIRMLQGQATDDESNRVRAWRTSSIANEERYRELARLWELTAKMAPHEATGRPPSANQIVRSARATSGNDVVSVRRPEFLTGRDWLKWGIAAAIFILVALGASEYVLEFGAGNPGLRAAAVVTGENDRATVRLGDGSVVRLGPGSRLSVTDDDAVREVWVDGRAFFSVAERKDKLFIVRTRAGQAAVLGTRFTVDMRADSMRVTVIEGSVALSAGQEEVEVRAGHASTAVRGTSPSVSEPVAARADLAWLGRFLAFQATPLTQVATAMERRFDIRVRILDDSLSRRTVTAWFSDRNTRQVLTTVCRVVDAHCTLNNGVATMQP